MQTSPFDAFATACATLRALRNRDISAVELLELHLARIERHNPALNAVVTLNTDDARQAAARADEARARGDGRPLLGLPFTVKDVLETAGLRTTAGYPPLADYVPVQDAPVVARLRAAGGVLLGKTNTPTLAMGAEPNNPIFGRTNNPWELLRSPGGSSGGEAAAVAAGLTPLGIGSDAGGSVRLPAHFCGVYALKPTEHRVPTTGHIPELPGTSRGLRHLATLGPLGRSAQDLALALSVVAGPDHHQWEVPPVPIQSAPPPKLEDVRVAWTEDFGLPTDHEIKAATERLAEDLQRQGARMRHELPDGFDMQRAAQVGLGIFNAEVPRSPEAQPGEREVTMREYIRLLDQRDRLIGALEAFFNSFDVLLCPVVGTPAWTHREPGTPVHINGTELSYWQTAMAHCMPFSLTGHPAVVLPLTRSREGLPIGVQLVGRRWGDEQLLAIAGLIAEFIGPFVPAPGFES